jgi:predicted lipid-binding transport protein (Tim44 family)
VPNIYPIKQETCAPIAGFLAHFLFYEAGGIGSLMFGATCADAGLFLNVKKATTMGMMIKIKARHIKPMARGAPIGSVVDAPLMVVVKGTPASPITPATHNPKPGQAQHKTVIIVKAIPTFLFIKPPWRFEKTKTILFSIQQKTSQGFIAFARFSR